MHVCVANEDGHMRLLKAGAKGNSIPLAASVGWYLILLGSIKIFHDVYFLSCVHLGGQRWPIVLVDIVSIF